MGYTGQCSCGEVDFAIASEPLIVAECWCNKCQRYGAGGSTVNAVFPADDVTTNGEVRWHHYLADSGTKVQTGFCPACGTHMFGILAGRSDLPDRIVIRVGAINRPHDIAPSLTVFAQEAPAWARLEGQPPISQGATDAPG